MDDLEEAIREGQELLDAVPQDYPDRAGFLNNLGIHLSQKYLKKRDLSDLEEAIRLIREAVCTASPENCYDRAIYLDNMLIQLNYKYSTTEAVSDLDEAIRVAQESLEITPENDLDREQRLDSLALLLADRYLRTDQIADLEQSIRFEREATDTTPGGHPRRAERLNALGSQLSYRYLRWKKAADLEEAIRVIKEALDAAPKGYGKQPGYLYNLSLQLGYRYLSTGATNDLEEAIRLGREAVDTTAETWSGRGSIWNNLGCLLENRFLRTGATTDLEEAIQLGKEAIDTLSKIHPTRPTYLDSLGLRYGYRYTRWGKTSDLEEAIRLGREALNTTPKGHPNRSVYLNNLEIHLCHHYAKTGMLPDLEEAIQLGREAVEITPEDHPNQASYLNNLGLSLDYKYRRTGNISTLQEAVECGQKATSITIADLPTQPTYKMSLGLQLSNRYSRTGAIIDLEEAIRIGQEAMETTPEESPDHAQRLNNIAGQLSYKYSRSKYIADLEEAIRLGREFLKMTPKDHSNRAGRLNNHGSDLYQSYLRKGEITDLEEAIRLGREAVNITPREDVNRPVFLENLGIQLTCRYHRITGAISDLEEGIRCCREAVDLTPEDHPDRAGCFNTLGIRLAFEFARTGALSDLEEAASAFESSLAHDDWSAVNHIQASMGAFLLYANTADWPKAYDTACIAVSLIPRLTTRSLENSDKQFILSQVAGLSSDASATALHLGKGPLVALDFLDQGRGLLAASLEEMRMDVLELRERHPKLAHRLAHLQDELSTPVTRDRALADLDGKPLWQVQVNRRSKANDELDKLIVEIRKQPEFDSFLLPPSQQELQNAAAYGPIVVINVSEYRCDAILIEKHQIRSLALPDLKSEEVINRAHLGDLGDPSVLEWLWNVAASPILEALGFSQPPSDNNWPHIWWIPTGSLSNFPLHAAGYHGKGSYETVLDRVMSSYSSSAKAIIQARRSRGTISPLNQALLVAMEHTPEQISLPFAIKEIDGIRGLLRSIDIDPIEPGLRTQDVISQLPQSKIFHFAGHGHTDYEDPSNSHLLLEDGWSSPLTVATLLEMNLREHSPFLAYLSACGTGQIKDAKFNDESIHLISAFQLAGFRHVIGTLWSVNDEICEHMAKATYEGIRDGGMTDESVCRGLHNATREHRERWLSVTEIARRKRSSRKKAGMSLRKHETVTRGLYGGYARNDTFSRDVESFDDDEDMAPLHWVPYIHFGV